MSAPGNFPRNFFLRSGEIRQRCADFLGGLDITACVYKVTVSIFKDPKSRQQEEKYHAMIGDIAAQTPTWCGTECDREDWKRLLVAAFDKVRGKSSRVVPSLDGHGVVILGSLTRYFTNDVAAEFIEYLYWYGAENEIEWSD
jgi:hypothetical protein